jgi:hypothetical protein
LGGLAMVRFRARAPRSRHHDARLSKRSWCFSRWNSARPNTGEPKY